MPEKPASLRALIQDRKAKQTRPTYRHLFTLSPDLYAERTDLEAALADTPPRPVRPADGKGQQPRQGGDDPRAALEKSLKELDEAIAAQSVVAVFKALSADQMAAKVAEWDKADNTALEQARDLILECFSRFVTDEDLGRDDLAELVPTLTQGETYAIANRLTDLSVGEVDVPKSIRRSVAARPSGATSKPA